MISVYATSKLRSRLPLDENGVLPTAGAAEESSSQNPLSGWHANLVRLQRRQCVIFVHDHSRFPLFIPCLKKPDFGNLESHFQDVLMNTLLKVGMPQEVLDRAAGYLSSLRFNHTLDRSVMGTLNQLVSDVDHRLWYRDEQVTELLPYSTSAWLSDRPCHAKGVRDCIWPVDAMRALLERTVH